MPRLKVKKPTRVSFTLHVNLLLVDFTLTFEW